MIHIDPANIQLSISPTSATHFVLSSNRKSSQRLVNSYITNFEMERTDNLLSVSAARKVRKSINWLVHTSKEKQLYQKDLKRHIKFRLSFITLTLCSKQVHSDVQIKDQCLNVFLQWLRDSYKVTKYIWKAEIQKNGNIHFHITMDKYIHYAKVQKAWNRCLEKLGYVSRFENEHGHRNPHSTEIKSVKNAKNLGSYLAAYLSGSKDSKSKKSSSEYNSRVIEGRLFGISSYLGQIKNIRICADELDFERALRVLRNYSEKAIYGDYSSTYIYSSAMGKSFVYWLYKRGYTSIFEPTNLTPQDLRAWLL